METELQPDEGDRVEIIWSPQPGPQTAFCACPVFEVFYGGSRGGGKTDAVLGEWVGHANSYGEHAVGLMVRRERTQLIETIERSKQLYSPLGAKFNEQEKQWRFPNNARLRFAYLDRDSDAEAYQGHSYSRVYVEEIGTFPNPAPIMKLMATLRSGAGVPVGFRATGNPGGPGHNWVKARYIDPAPMGWEILTEEFSNPWNGEKTIRERVFIPSSLKDNKYLGSDYVANLQMSGSPELVRAWLEGDWNVVAGSFFPEFGSQHVIQPFPIPAHWMRYGAYDHGYASPHCYLWFAVSDGVNTHIPRGALVVYREDYPNGSPNVGERLTAFELGKRILARTGAEKLAYTVADPSVSKKEGGPSIREEFMKAGLPMVSADNNRAGGWNQIRTRLKGNAEGQPMLYMFSTCKHLVRTLPTLQHDEHNLEDCDTDGEDHAPDALRYGCMARPFVVTEKAVVPITAKPKIGDLVSQHLKQQKRMRA